jgi:hypothetical protein
MKSHPGKDAIFGSLSRREQDLAGTAKMYCGVVNVCPGISGVGPVWGQSTGPGAAERGGARPG